MIEVTCAQVAAITSGTLHGFSAGTEDRLIRSVVVDSRDASPGSLFVAIAGAKVDGHDYALAAVQAGAIVVLSARELPLPCIVVADPVQAL
ncbi:MAG: Mur ligase domain-containing protein, partial [Actinomycetales bacterium]